MGEHHRGTEAGNSFLMKPPCLRASVVFPRAFSRIRTKTTGITTKARRHESAARDRCWSIRAGFKETLCLCATNLEILRATRKSRCHPERAACLRGRNQAPGASISERLHRKGAKTQRCTTSSLVLRLLPRASFSSLRLRAFAV